MNSSYLDLAMTSTSLNKIKCLSWVCRPMVSCTRSSRMKVEPGLLNTPLGSPLSEWEEERVVSLEEEEKIIRLCQKLFSQRFVIGHRQLFWNSLIAPCFSQHCPYCSQS